MIVAARFVVVDCRTVLADGAVRIRSGRVESVGPRSHLLPSAGRGERLVDLPDAVVLPGLVNAHVHLELSALKGRTPRRASFSEWLLAVVRERRALSPSKAVAAMRAALAEAVGSGTTAFGEISSAGLSAPVLAASGARAVVFEEAIALDPAAAAGAERDLRRRLRTPAATARCARGVSPHAPYSVSAELYRRCARLARERRSGLVLATHASETPEEADFVDRAGGPLRGFLEGVGALPPRFRAPAPGRTPVEYLASLGVLSRRTILAHANHLARADVETVARCGATVVFCPGTHLFFGRPAHPLPRLLRAGARVALGTDGLTSNDKLDLFAEMARASRLFPGLSPETIFDLATRAGAEALGLEGVGRLAPGSVADLVAVGAGRSRKAGGVIESLASSGPRDVRLVLVGGSNPRALERREKRAGDRR